MRVAVDATPLLHARTGVGQMTAGLVEVLAPRADVELTAYAVTWSGRHALAGLLPPRVRAATAPVPARAARAAWRRVALPHIEHWTGAVDVVHATNFVAPPAKAAVVVTVHDLTALRWPELCTPDVRRVPELVRIALRRGAVVHAVSDYVAAEVREAFGLDADRVVRVYQGVEATDSGDPARGRALTRADRYVLALGTIEPRKNLDVLVRAFDELATTDPDVVLVLAGPEGWGAEAVHQAITAAAHRDRILRLDYLDDAARADLLAGASVLAYPSRYEGFGRPPLEAMTAGVAVVAARAGAVPEVTGDAAWLVEPGAIDELAGALQTVLHDHTRREDMIARGRARAATFRWTVAADEMVALYRRARDTR